MTCAASVFVCRPRTRGGGVLNKCLYGEAPSYGSTPYPFIYHFSQKRYPFHIPSIDKWYPLSRFKDIFWVNCPFYLLVKLSFTLTSLKTSLQSTIKVKSVRTFQEILVKLVTSPPPPTVWGHNIGGRVSGEGCDEPKVEPKIATTSRSRVICNNSITWPEGPEAWRAHQLYLRGFFRRLWCMLHTDLMKATKATAF